MTRILTHILITLPQKRLHFPLQIHSSNTHKILIHPRIYSLFSLNSLINISFQSTAPGLLFTFPSLLPVQVVISLFRNPPCCRVSNFSPLNWPFIRLHFPKMHILLDQSSHNIDPYIYLSSLKCCRFPISNPLYYRIPAPSSINLLIFQPYATKYIYPFKLKLPKHHSLTHLSSLQKLPFPSSKPPLLRYIYSLFYSSSIISILIPWHPYTLHFVKTRTSAYLRTLPPQIGSHVPLQNPFTTHHLLVSP